MSYFSKKDVDDDVSAFTSSSSGIIEIEKKLVLVGDGAVGKTCCLHTFGYGRFPEDYVPTYWDNLVSNIQYKDNKVVKLSLWDTHGAEDYSRLRPLSYPVDPTSLENVKTMWYPELQEFMGAYGEYGSSDVPIILVGSKLDLREDPQVLRELQEREERPVTRVQGEQVAREIKAAGYMEISSMTRKNLKELFDKAVEVAMGDHDPPKRKGGFFLTNWITSIKEKIKEKEKEREMLKKEREREKRRRKEEEEERKRKEEEERKIREEEEKLKKKLAELEEFQRKLMETKVSEEDSKKMQKRREELRKDEEKSESLCQLCYASDKNCVIIPCGHTLCFDCGKQLRAGKNLCCYCKRKIEMLQRIIL